MFGPLSETATLSGYHNSHIVRFDTLYSSGVYKIFAVIKSETPLDGKLLQTEFVDDVAFLDYVELLCEQSDINTTVEVLGSDEIVTLVSYGREGQTLIASMSSRPRLMLKQRHKTPLLLQRQMENNRSAHSQRKMPKRF